MTSRILPAPAVITFDCFGTLVDWETGILASLRPLFAATGKRFSDEDILAAYARAESDAEAAEYMSYRDVLGWSLLHMANRHDLEPAASELDILARELPAWPLFPDTAEALARISRRCKVVIASNCDDDLIAPVVARLGIAPALVITAQQQRAYKPALQFFEPMLRRIEGEFGVARTEILHAGQSQYHDIAPANALGLRSTWIHRRTTGEATPRPGAVLPAAARPDYTFATLAEFADALGA